MTLNRKWLPGLGPLSHHNESLSQKETDVCMRGVLISKNVYKSAVFGENASPIIRSHTMTTKGGARQSLNNTINKQARKKGDRAPHSTKSKRGTLLYEIDEPIIREYERIRVDEKNNERTQRFDTPL